MIPLVRETVLHFLAPRKYVNQRGVRHMEQVSKLTMYENNKN